MTFLAHFWKTKTTDNPSRCPNDPAQIHGFVFLDSPSRIHIVAWDPEARLWKVPCGLVPPRRGAVTYNLDKPMCRICDRLTSQTTTDPAIPKDSPR